MANKNLFPKENTAVKTNEKANKSKKVTKSKPEEKQPQPEQQEATKAKPTKGKVKVSTSIKPKKPSMVASALQVLGHSKEPMTCKELVEAMVTKGLWASPNGKTPANTLYSAFLRLIQNQGKAAPVRKADKGTFAINPSATA
jgi:hypothetical protein